jgi:hypothetical protein
MKLAAPNHDAVTFSFHHPGVKVRVSLVGWAFNPISFHIRLSTAAHEVFCLESFKPFFEILMVLRSPIVGFIGFIAYIVYAIGCVDPHAALNTPTHLPTEKPCHILFFMQIVCVLMNMGEPIDLLPGQV